MRYLIVNSKSKTAIPEELLTEETPYDRSAYVILLTRSMATLLEPFGYSQIALEKDLRCSMNISSQEPL